MSAIAAVILAGGRSSRMGGGDKGLLEIAGRPMLTRIIERISPDVQQMAINANGDPARFAAFSLPVVADNQQTFDGPLAGVFSALQWAGGEGFDRVLTLAGDTPFFPADLATRLSEAASTSTIAVAASRGRLHPAFAIWPTALTQDLDSQLAKGRRRVADFIERHPNARIEFPDVDLSGEMLDPFFNINTPDDLAEARRIANRLEP